MWFITCVMNQVNSAGIANSVGNQIGKKSLPQYLNSPKILLNKVST